MVLTLKFKMRCFSGHHNTDDK